MRGAANQSVRVVEGGGREGEVRVAKRAAINREAGRKLAHDRRKYNEKKEEEERERAAAPRLRETHSPERPLPSDEPKKAEEGDAFRLFAEKRNAFLKERERAAGASHLMEVSPSIRNTAPIDEMEGYYRSGKIIEKKKGLLPELPALKGVEELLHPKDLPVSLQILRAENEQMQAQMQVMAMQAQMSGFAPVISPIPVANQLDPNYNVGASMLQIGQAPGSKEIVSMQGMGIGVIDPSAQAFGLGVIDPAAAIYVPPLPEDEAPEIEGALKVPAIQERAPPPPMQMSLMPDGAEMEELHRQIEEQRKLGEQLAKQREEYEKKKAKADMEMDRKKKELADKEKRDKEEKARREKEEREKKARKEKEERERRGAANRQAADEQKGLRPVDWEAEQRRRMAVGQQELYEQGPEAVYSSARPTGVVALLQAKMLGGQAQFTREGDAGALALFREPTGALDDAQLQMSQAHMGGGGGMMGAAGEEDAFDDAVLGGGMGMGQMGQMGHMGMGGPEGQMSSFPSHLSSNALSYDTAGGYDPSYNAAYNAVNNNAAFAAPAGLDPNYAAFHQFQSEGAFSSSPPLPSPPAAGLEGTYMGEGVEGSAYNGDFLSSVPSPSYEQGQQFHQQQQYGGEQQGDAFDDDAGASAAAAAAALYYQQQQQQYEQQRAQQMDPYADDPHRFDAVKAQQQRESLNNFSLDGGAPPLPSAGPSSAYGRGGAGSHPLPLPPTSSSSSSHSLPLPPLSSNAERPSLPPSAGFDRLLDLVHEQPHERPSINAALEKRAPGRLTVTEREAPPHNAAPAQQAGAFSALRNTVKGKSISAAGYGRNQSVFGQQAAAGAQMGQMDQMAQMGQMGQIGGEGVPLYVPADENDDFDGPVAGGDYGPGDDFASYNQMGQGAGGHVEGLYMNNNNSMGSHMGHGGGGGAGYGGHYATPGGEDPLVHQMGHMSLGPSAASSSSSPFSITVNRASGNIINLDLHDPSHSSFSAPSFPSAGPSSSARRVDEGDESHDALMPMGMEGAAPVAPSSPRLSMAIRSVQLRKTVPKQEEEELPAFSLPNDGGLGSAFNGARERIMSSGSNFAQGHGEEEW